MRDRRACLSRGGVSTPVLIALVSGIVSVIAISIWVHQSHSSRLHRVATKIYHLKDGRFCYRQHAASGGDDAWFWLCNADSGGYYTGSSTLGSRMPAGTVWQSSASRSGLASKPTEIEEEEIGQEDMGTEPGSSEVEVAENSDDSPASVDEGGASASSSDEGDGGSSSGGGDDGGGDGGGGGGGDDD